MDAPNSDVNHRNLSYWLKEFGCMDGNPQGVLHVYTDDEVAVGAVFQDAKLARPPMQLGTSRLMLPASHLMTLPLLELVQFCSSLQGSQ